MSDVLEIHEVRFVASDLIVVEAVVDEMVLMRASSRFDPPEWRPALCRGTMLLCEEDIIPSSDAGLRKLFSQRIDDWAPVSESDLYD